MDDVFGVCSYWLRIRTQNTHSLARRRNSLFFILELVIFHRLARELFAIASLEKKISVGSSTIFNIIFFFCSTANDSSYISLFFLRSPSVIKCVCG